MTMQKLDINPAKVDNFFDDLLQNRHRKKQLNRMLRKAAQSSDRVHRYKELTIVVHTDRESYGSFRIVTENYVTMFDLDAKYLVYFIGCWDSETKMRQAINRLCQEQAVLFTQRLL